MNSNQILYNTAYSMLVKMLPSGIDEESLQEYFVGDQKNPKDLRDVFVALIKTAQNYQYMPNVIQFDKREQAIGCILNDFDYKYACTLDPTELYRTFRNEFGAISEHAWQLWSKAVVDSASFVQSFSSLSDFNAYVTGSSNLKKVPITISNQIRGIGFALACNALKELGYFNYVKPDVHLIDICVELGITDKDPLKVFDAMLQIASDNCITPYKLDKVLWLVCSGNFYKDHVRITGKKNELIMAIKNALGKNAGCDSDKATKYSNSNSDVQLGIEKVLIKMFEEKHEITGLENDSYLYFKGNANTKIKPDIFSEELCIIGEVYSHIGKLKPSQMDKISADILKMILFEEDSGKQFDKYYVICDKEVKKCMYGNAVVSNAIRIHKLHIECFDLPESQTFDLKIAMKKQNLLNHN